MQALLGEEAGPKAVFHLQALAPAKLPMASFIRPFTGTRDNID